MFTSIFIAIHLILPKDALDIKCIISSIKKKYKLPIFTNPSEISEFQLMLSSSQYVVLNMRHGMGQIYPIHYDAVRLIVPRRRDTLADANANANEADAMRHPNRPLRHAQIQQQQHGGDINRVEMSSIACRSWLAVAWMVFVLAAATLRFWTGCPLMRMCPGFAALCLNTWAFTLGSSTTSGCVRTDATPTEFGVLGVLGMCSVQAASLFAGILFHGQMQEPQRAKQIETWQDFVDLTSLELVTPAELYPQRVQAQLHLNNMNQSGLNGLAAERMGWAQLVTVQRMLWDRDTSVAYRMADSNLDLLNSPRLRYENGEPVFHVAGSVLGELNVLVYYKVFVLGWGQFIGRN